MVSLVPHLVASHFLLLWLLSLVIIAASAAWLAPTIAPRSRRPRPSPQPTPGDITCAILFGLFLAFYVAMILYREDFAFFDNHLLTDFSVAGRALAPPIWPAEGRFFPLAFQEFNVLRFLTRSPVGYQLFSVGELFSLLVALWLLLGRFRLRDRVLLLSALLVTPAFSISFTGLVYPERDILVGLAILLVSLERYAQTRSRACFVSCLVSTHFVLYYKETVGVFVAAFALSFLLFQFFTKPPRSWREFVTESALPIALLAVCAIYAAFFLLATLPWGNSSYVAQHRQPLHSVLGTYLAIDWMAWLLLAVFLVRLARWFVREDRLDPLWDSLALAALAYFCSILAVRLIAGYYLAPVDLVAFLYLGRLAFTWLAAAPRPRVALLAAALICLLGHDAAYSWFRIIERKSLIIASRRLADFLGNYLSSARASSVDLYFPYASGHELETLSAYLKYRGIPLEEPGFLTRSRRPQFVIQGPGEFIANKCMEYSAYTCIHADRPSPGALLILTPDDNVRTSDVDALASSSVLLFRLKPPEYCRSKSSWLRFFYVISPEFAATGLPDHWLELDVFHIGGEKLPRSASASPNDAQRYSSSLICWLR